MTSCAVGVCLPGSILHINGGIFVARKPRSGYQGEACVKSSQLRDFCRDEEVHRVWISKRQKLRVWYFLLQASGAAMSHCVLVNSMERPSGAISFAISTHAHSQVGRRAHLAGSARALTCVLLVGAIHFKRLPSSAFTIFCAHAKDEVLERCNAVICRKRLFPCWCSKSLRVVAVTDNGDVAVELLLMWIGLVNLSRRHDRPGNVDVAVQHAKCCDVVAVQQVEVRTCNPSLLHTQVT